MPICLDNQNGNIGMLANGLAVDSYYKHKSKSRGCKAFQMLVTTNKYLWTFNGFLSIYTAVNCNPKSTVLQSGHKGTKISNGPKAV